MKIRIALTVVLAALALAVLLPEDAGAMPAFARRHKISCTTCHAPFPRLKDYGDEFAGNGFIIPEEEKDRDYVAAGDDLLRLNKDVPLAFRFDAFAVYDDATDDETDFQTPWGIKMLSGGALAPNVGYYFYFYMAEKGEVAGIEDAIIHFDNLFGSELDVAVGQFQTSDPLLKRELRLTYEDYLFYKPHVGYSNVNLTYDRGFMLSYGFPTTGTDLVATITNGNGKGEPGEDDRFDSDGNRNVGLRLTQALGGHLTVGGYYYTGREDFGEEGENEVTYWGPDVAASYGPFALVAQYLTREDSDPLLDGSQEKVETDGAIVELTILPKGDLSRHVFTVLYNQVDSDLDAVDIGDHREAVGYYNQETLTFGSTYLLARNLRLTAEFTRDLEQETSRFTLGTVAAF